MDSAESARPAPAEQATAEWTDLENSLADYLEGAASTPKHNSLLLEVTGEYDDSGCTPYVEVFTVGGGKEFRIELSGNAHLAPMFQLSTEKLHQLEEDDWQVPTGANPYRTMPSSSASAAAGAVTHLLHHTCGLSDPRLLSYQAAGPSAAGAARLGLRRSDQVPVDVVDTTPPLASYAKDSDELRAMVHAAVRTYLQDEPEVDEDGDIVIRKNGRPIWVGVNENMPAVIIFSRVAENVRSRQSAALELGLLNRDHAWVSWVLRGRNVWQQLTVPATPFSPPQLRTMLHNFAHVMKRTREDLTYRVESDFRR